MLSRLATHGAYRRMVHAQETSKTNKAVLLSKIVGQSLLPTALHLGALVARPRSRAVTAVNTARTCPLP